MHRTETKICNNCNREMVIDNFRVMRLSGTDPYHLGRCKECEKQYLREYKAKKNKITFSDNLEILVHRQFKEIKPERILDLSATKLLPIGTDEQFVKLMDYKGYYLSNYGRVIHSVNGQYVLLTGGYDSNKSKRYTVTKNVYIDGQWADKKVMLYAAKAVVDEFIVNPDTTNNIYIWHSGNNKEDYYFRNLYPLNKEQYYAVRRNYLKNGVDTEDFIIKVMNDIKYKPDNWSKKSMQPIMCGIGYRGIDDAVVRSETYIRWHDMIHRCYNDKFHERQPQYSDCRVCKEWLNYSNFKKWYDENIYGVGDETMDLDKDILFKGNKVYSPECCVFVPHSINTLFLNCKQNRGDLPLGVHLDKDKGKYRACVASSGKSIKLGTFDNVIDAFERYKEYKENLIKKLTEQYRSQLPYKVYQAMLEWQIEITD